jgi:hypothetical protein
MRASMRSRKAVGCVVEGMANLRLSRAKRMTTLHHRKRHGVLGGSAGILIRRPKMNLSLRSRSSHLTLRMIPVSAGFATGL